MKRDLLDLPGRQKRILQCLRTPSVGTHPRVSLVYRYRALRGCCHFTAVGSEASAQFSQRQFSHPLNRTSIKHSTLHKPGRQFLEQSRHPTHKNNYMYYYRITENKTSLESISLWDIFFGINFSPLNQNNVNSPKLNILFIMGLKHAACRQLSYTLCSFLKSDS